MSRGAVRAVPATGIALATLIASGTSGFSGTLQEPAEPETPQAISEHEVELLASQDLQPTTGAAPGYLPDAACARCHSRLAQSYRRLGMARSFAPPGSNGWVEDFESNELYHEPSDRYYRMTRDGGDLAFRRWQRDEDGREINVFEREVDWILGSASVARTYLYQTPGGELFQLPVAWYTQEQKWGMAPGFDRPDHEGVTRRIRRQCLFCHNAYPEVGADSDLHHAPHVFPRELPHGIGCQRCHGPGARHVAAVLDGSSPEEVARRIVNPAVLLPTLRRDVCNQCHFQPSVTVFGMRRFERGDYSYRAGEALADYQVQIEVDESRNPGEESFEINHHGYRLESSRCFRESGGGLDCLSCHDPHTKPARSRLLARSREVCLGCHDSGPDLSAEHLSRAGCTSCHMPRRRAHDVVHGVMTDHRIQTGPAPGDWLAPRPEVDPVLEDLRLVEEMPDRELAGIYRAVATLRAGSLTPTHWLRDRLHGSSTIAPTPWLDLARAQMRSQAWDELEATLRRLRQISHQPLILEWSAILELGRGHNDSALQQLKQAVAESPLRPEAHFNLARTASMSGETALAISGFESALDLRPNMMMAWLELGRLLLEDNKIEEAVASLRRVTEIEPRFPLGYQALAVALRRAGQTEEAERYLRHGQRVAAHLASRRPVPR